MLHDLCCLKIGKDIVVTNGSIDDIRHVFHVGNGGGEVADMTIELLAGLDGESLRNVCMASLLSTGTSHSRCT